jgi:deazaflavin-dependent oxidoreductase (nitroreductase family)
MTSGSTPESKAESKATGSGSPPPRWLLKAITRTHVFLHRLSGGRWFNKLGGDEVCFVTMTGARSGRTLTIPLMYVPYQEGVLLVASQGGAPNNPVWYHNLVKHPDIHVTHRGRRMRLRARLATADEKPGLWPICDEHYAPYADYRKRTTRDIPIFVCQPTS